MIKLLVRGSSMILPSVDKASLTACSRPEELAVVLLVPEADDGLEDAEEPEVEDEEEDDDESDELPSDRVVFNFED